MKILYRQPKCGSVMEKLHISECCAKYIDLQRDINSTTPKTHHHTETEIHIMISGKQKYEFSDGIHEISSGMFMIIPSGVAHRAVDFKDGSKKYSFTFVSENKTPFAVDELPSINLISDISALSEDGRELSSVLLENRIFELLLSLLRRCGYKEKSVKIPAKTESRMELAKKYISDNIYRRLTVSEVAAHVYICPKQLNRLFREYEGISPVRYIENEKCKIASKLLKETENKAGKVGEMLGFSEQYFNLFFKRNCGMTPGEYKKMNK